MDEIVRDFWLPSRCELDLRSSGTLGSVVWWLVTDVFGQPIGPIFKGNDKLSGNVPKRR
jgi:hypothetical protein